MKENDKKEDDFNSVFEEEGIIIENESPQENKSIEMLKTKGADKELFDAIGVEIKETTEIEDTVATTDMKEALNKEGVDVLPYKASYDSNDSQL